MRKRSRKPENRGIKTTVNLGLYKNDKFQLQVVTWGRGKPQLAKQELYEDQNGQIKAGKIKGLTLEDLELVKANWKSVQAALQGQVLEDGDVPESTPAPRSGKVKSRPVAEVEEVEEEESEEYDYDYDE